MIRTNSPQISQNKKISQKTSTTTDGLQCISKFHFHDLKTMLRSDDQTKTKGKTNICWDFLCTLIDGLPKTYFGKILLVELMMLVMIVAMVMMNMVVCHLALLLMRLWLSALLRQSSNNSHASLLLLILLVHHVIVILHLLLLHHVVRRRMLSHHLTLLCWDVQRSGIRHNITEFRRRRRN